MKLAALHCIISCSHLDIAWWDEDGESFWVKQVTEYKDHDEKTKPLFYRYIDTLLRMLEVPSADLGKWLNKMRLPSSNVTKRQDSVFLVGDSLYCRWVIWNKKGFNRDLDLHALSMTSDPKKYVPSKMKQQITWAWKKEDLRNVKFGLITFLAQKFVYCKPQLNLEYYNDQIETIFDDFQDDYDFPMFWLRAKNFQQWLKYKSGTKGCEHCQTKCKLLIHDHNVKVNDPGFWPGDHYTPI